MFKKNNTPNWIIILITSISIYVAEAEPIIKFIQAFNEKKEDSIFYEDNISNSKLFLSKSNLITEKDFLSIAVENPNDYGVLLVSLSKDAVKKIDSFNSSDADCLLVFINNKVAIKSSKPLLTSDGKIRLVFKPLMKNEFLDLITLIQRSLKGN
jgi:hypothetical protein